MSEKTDPGGEALRLVVAGVRQLLPELGVDVGHVLGACDGRRVDAVQVGQAEGWPLRALKVKHHYLLLRQHKQGRGRVVVCNNNSASS